MLRDFIPANFQLGCQSPGCHLQADPRLSPMISENFTAITPGANFGVKQVFRHSDKPDFEVNDWVVNHFRDSGIEIHGHVLVEGRADIVRWRQLTRLELEQKLKESVQTIVDRYRDSISEWDVLGEVISPRGGLVNCFWKKHIGPSFAPKVCQWVKDCNPDARLYYSDYGLESRDKLDAVLIFFEALQEYGVKLDGMALQFHHHTKGSLNQRGFKKAVQSFHNLGLATKISEVTIWQDLTGLGDAVEKIQAHCYGKLLDLAIVEGCRSLTFWAPFDDYAWQLPEKTPGLWDDFKQPKLAYFEIEKKLRRWQRNQENQKVIDVIDEKRKLVAEE